MSEFLYIKEFISEGDHLKSTITQNGKWIHIDWELDGVTARMLDWFWCNMDKCDYLWHPNQHNGFEWYEGYSVIELGTPINSIHIAPQTWGDNVAFCPHIRMEALANTPDFVLETIKYDHVMISAGIAMERGDIDPQGPPMAWRVHQWQANNAGVVGMSSGITADGCDADSGPVWADHAVEEVGNWEVFLPRLYELYKVIQRSDICPYHSFELQGTGRDAKYLYL